MFEKLFTKPNLHALAVCVIVGAATSLQSLIAAGTWTWHALLFGLIGGVLSAAAGWLIRQLNGAPPANGTAAIVAFLLLLLPLASCSPPAAEGAPVLVRGPLAFSGVLAPGDSVGPYIFTAPAVSGATGYSWTLTASATNGTWANLPAGAATSTPTLTFTVASGGTWDSVSFQLCMKGTSPVRSSKGQACTSWKLYRYLSSPTSLTGDSSRLGPLSLMLRSPQEDSLKPGGGVYAHTQTGAMATFCAFIRFGSGDVAGVTPNPTCPTVATANFRASRLASLTGAESAWLSGSCTPWANCLAGLGLGRRVPTDALLVHAV